MRYPFFFALWRFLYVLLIKIMANLGQATQKCCLSLMSFGCPQGETEGY